MVPVLQLDPHGKPGQAGRLASVDPTGALTPQVVIQVKVESSSWSVRQLSEVEPVEEATGPSG